MSTQRNAGAAIFQKESENGIWNEIVAPKSLIAILGLTTAIVSMEAYRYPAVLTVNYAGTYVFYPHNLLTIEFSTLATVIGLALLTLLCWKFPRKLFFSPATMAAAAIIVMLGYIGRFDAGCNACLNAGLNLFTDVSRFFSFFLLAGWAKHLYEQEGEASATFLVVSFLASGLLQVLLGFLQPLAAAFGCSLTPILSFCFFILHRSDHAKHDSIPTMPPFSKTDRSREGQDSDKDLNAVASGLKGSSTLPKRQLITLVICFLCYGAICFFLHSSWLPAQEISQGPYIIQMFGALGTFAAAALLIVILKAETQSFGGTLYKILVFFTLVIALFISNFASQNALASLFTSLLDAAHKIIVFAAWAIPLKYAHEGNRVGLFSALLCAYQAGSLLTRSLTSTPEGQFILLLISLGFLSIDLALSIIKRLGGVKQPAEPNNDIIAENKTMRAQIEAYKQIMFTVYLSDTFKLTRREFEVASLLAEGKTVREIADELVISQETAKTHRRNILHKLDVGSQQELIEKIDFVRENDFRDFIRHIGDDDAASEQGLSNAEEPTTSQS